MDWIPDRHWRRIPSMRRPDNSSSPAMCRVSSIARQADTSALATFSVWATVRTL
jgi:hypothetical protein